MLEGSQYPITCHDQQNLEQKPTELRTKFLKLGRELSSEAVKKDLSYISSVKNMKKMLKLNMLLDAMENGLIH